MKTKILFFLSSLALACQAGTISTYTQTNSAGSLDLLLLDSLTNSSPAKYITRGITVSNLMSVTNGATGATNGAGTDFDMRRTTLDSQTWNQYHMASYNDSLAYVEQWNSLSNWASINLVVSNNAVYAQNDSGNPSGANYGFVLGSTDEARITTTITFTSGISTSNAVVWLGVSTDAAGTTPPAGDGNTVAMGLNLNNQFSVGVAGQTTPFFWNKGTYSGSTNLLLPGTYSLQVCIDTNNLSFSLVYPGHTNEFTQVVSRSSVGNISNVSLWMGDQRALGGFAIGPVGIRKAAETSASRTNGIEGGNDGVINTTLGSDNVRVWLPPQYDSRNPIPLVLWCHGRGATYSWPWYGQSLGGTNGWPERPFFESLVTNVPCIVISSDLGGNLWGNQTAINAVSNTLALAQRHYSISSVFVAGSSMGGVTALNFVQQHAAEVNGCFLLYPVCSLLSMSNSYWSDITNAYPGIITSGWAAGTAGYDPITMPANRFWRVPMRFYHNLGDTVAYAVSNCIPFEARITNVVPESGIILSGGTLHGDPQDYNAPDVISFIQRRTTGFKTNYPPGNGAIFPNLQVIGNLAANTLSGQGTGLWNIPASAIIGTAFTNGTAGINISSTLNGPGFFGNGSLNVSVAGSSGFQWNNQNNTTAWMDLNNGALSGLTSIAATTHTGTTFLGTTVDGNTVNAGSLISTNGIATANASSHSMATHGWTNSAGRVVRVFNLSASGGTTYFSNTVSGANFTINPNTGASFFELEPNDVIFNPTGSLTANLLDF